MPDLVVEPFAEQQLQTNEQTSMQWKSTVDTPQEVRGHQGSPRPYFRNIRKLAIVLALLPLTTVLMPASVTHAAAARTMTVEEYQFALTIFEREFPPRDQITITDQTGLGGAFFVRPTVGELVPGKKGYIRMNLGRMFANPLSPENRSTFVHELTHAWQIEHFELAWYLKPATSNQVLSSDAYSYVCDPVKKLSDYNAEREADRNGSACLGAALSA